MIDPTQQAAPAGQPPAAQGNVICIAAAPDGSFMVYPEGGEASNAAPMDLDAALDYAAELLEGSAGAPGAGQPDQAKQENADADALFGQAFDKARGRM